MRGGWSFRGPCSEELAVSADQDCHQVLDEGSSCQEDGMRKIWLWMSLVQALQTSQRAPRCLALPAARNQPASREDSTRACHQPP